MLPPTPPPALLRPPDEPSRFQAASEAFQGWMAREKNRGVPLLNPWKPSPAPDSKEVPGALVEVWDSLPPLETETQEVLRLTVAWIIARRFEGSAAGASPAPPLAATLPWESTHPGGNRAPGAVPLGWRRWR